MTPQSVVEWASSWVPEKDRARFAEALAQELSRYVNGDESCDRHYILGAHFGWNCGVTGDREKLDKAIECRNAALRDISSSKP